MISDLFITWPRLAMVISLVMVMVGGISYGDATRRVS